MPRPWFVDGFGEHYLELYAHRNEREAAEAIALLAAAGVELARRRILDLAAGRAGTCRCCAGGAPGAGPGPSCPLLTAARGRLAPRLALVRGDMRRLPFADASFDGVLSMFTSFGYFRATTRTGRCSPSVARAPAGRLFSIRFLESAPGRGALRGT